MSQTQRSGLLSHTRVARLWAVCFFTILVWLCVSPGTLAAFIEWFATTLGLSGAVPAPTQTLWYPLAIAYMATVTVLAWQCGGDPALSAPYRALLAAKVGSTLGFLALAPRGGAVWVLLAAGDAFVAFTLWFTRRTA